MIIIWSLGLPNASPFCYLAVRNFLTCSSWNNFRTWECFIVKLNLFATKETMYKDNIRGLLVIVLEFVKTFGFLFACLQNQNMEKNWTSWIDSSSYSMRIEFWFPEVVIYGVTRGCYWCPFLSSISESVEMNQNRWFFVLAVMQSYKWEGYFVFRRSVRVSSATPMLVLQKKPHGQSCRSGSSSNSLRINYNRYIR